MSQAAAALGFSSTNAALLVFLVPATSVASIVVAAVVTSDTSVDYTVVVDALVFSSEEIVSVAFVVGSSFVVVP